MSSPKTYHQEFDPSQELHSVIKCFWYDKIIVRKKELSFEVIPDGYAEIIFYFGSSCSSTVNGILEPLPSPFIIGLLHQPVRFFSEDFIEIIGIRCFPWTIFDLLELPSGKDGVQKFEHPIAQLQSKLNDLILAYKIDAAIAEIRDYFINVKSQIPSNSMLFKAGIAMRNTNGSMPISEVAESAHATIRTLERTFKESSGYSLKDVSGLIRFEQVRNHLLLNPTANLAGLAQQLGYTDQSHLSREFKRYSGTIPAAFARNAKKQQTLNSDFNLFLVTVNS